MDWKCVACGMVDLVVKGSKCSAMVDTGAEMNIIRETDALKFGLEVDRSDCGVLHGANCKAVFCGTASNVLIEVGKVKVRACFFVMHDVNHDVLLGRSFLCRTETLMFNKHDGTLILIMCDPACGNYEIITCRNTGPRSIRNRPNPGSFTIEESENERRRLHMEPKEEERGEIFSLSLADINKAMDVVATPEMADPDAIQALREQVLECPQEGELELVYRVEGFARGPGRDGVPIRLQDGSVDEFLPAYERCMRVLDYPREEWMQTLLLWTRPAERSMVRQIRDKAADWEGCQARLRREFWQPKPERREPERERRQEPRPSPIGVDGRPIRLAIGNVEEFIPGFEQFMLRQQVVREDWMVRPSLWTRKANRPLARYVADMAQDWESCRAHLRVAFRRFKPRSPAGERRTLSEAGEPGTSRGGRQATTGQGGRRLAELEESGAIPECGLGPIDLPIDIEPARVPPHPRDVTSSLGDPLQDLEAHLDASRWGTPSVDEGPSETMEEGPQRPPPVTGSRLATIPEGSHEGEEESPRETVQSPPVEVPPREGVEAERRPVDLRREAIMIINTHTAAFAQECPDMEGVGVEDRPQRHVVESLPRGPVPEGLVGEPCAGRQGVGPELSAGEAHPTDQREAAETKEERRATRLVEIWEDTRRLEEAGELPDQAPESPPRPRNVMEVWDRYFEGDGEGLVEPARAGFDVARTIEGSLERKLHHLARTSFSKHLMLEGELVGRRWKDGSLGVRLEAAEEECQELRARTTGAQGAVDRWRTGDTTAEPEVVVRAGEMTSSQVEERTEREVDWTEGDRYGAQSGTAGSGQEPSIGRVMMESAEVQARREAEQGAYEFRPPTELVMHIPASSAEDRPPPAPIPPCTDDERQGGCNEAAQGPADGAMDVLLDVLDMTGVMCTPLPERMVGPTHELSLEGEVRTTQSERPQRLDMSEHPPERMEWQRESSAPGQGARSTEEMGLPQCYEVDREGSEAPSSSRSQGKKRKLRKTNDSACFFCKDGVHWALQCPVLARDVAAGRATSDESPAPHVLTWTLTPYLQWPACLEELGSDRSLPSQQDYLNPYRIIDLAFFQRVEDKEVAAGEEEEDVEEGGDEGETPEEGSYSEHSEGEQSEEEEDEEEEGGSEWETLPEEEERHEEDPEAVRKKEEIAAGKRQLEFASGANLRINDNLARDPEAPRPEDGDLTATTSSTSRRRWSRYPSPSTSARPLVHPRTDAGNQPSSSVIIPPSP
ncbi:hypothetical protein CBR_g59761 [Chara braunii]|uniref:Peptidase A2 domain-containing protein n=1 Tax=Chara braunii TaxID=69332 RepID=A0A388MF08_CHABU|nr:hypothetical protein CBR_g59761 [Chara braunii]|eukprot:GBG93158.1 hypothetical protein CBR_g59761 [Chara braunii]